MKSVLIFGRQPDLGLAEAESLYGSENVTPLESGSAIVNIDPCNLSLKRLGGSIKLAKLLTEIESTDWRAVEKYLVENSPGHSKDMPNGKMTLGISAYNFSVSAKQVTSTAIRIKKAIQVSGRSVRVVPNKDPILNSASVTHNKLTAEKGWELLIIKSQNKAFIAQTVLVQDIRAYSRRDQARPNRDARVGMLPPKLAQIIINLASPKIVVNNDNELCEPAKLEYNQTVLDPFCGSGVILQESLLMGFSVEGSDINQKMVEYAKGNLSWLNNEYRMSEKAKIEVKLADATTAIWSNFDFVATETSLGRPLSDTPDNSELDEIVKKSDELVSKFLENLAGQAKSGSKHCIAVPAWQVSKNQFRHLGVIDRLEELGYNSVDFKHLDTKQLLYYRPDQIVARQLLVISRK